MPTAIIIDDHPAIRFAVRMILESEGFTVPAETDNGLDAIQLIVQHEPDLVILDIGIPKLDGLEVISRIRAKGLSSKIVVFTSQNAQILALRCLQAGASGYFQKENNLNEILTVVHAVIANYICYPAPISPSGITEIMQESHGSVDPSLLSNREVMVLQCLAKGMSNKEIADKINLSNKTVSTYKMRLMEKTNAKSLIDLLNFAKQHNLG